MTNTPGSPLPFSLQALGSVDQAGKGAAILWDPGALLFSGFECRCRVGLLRRRIALNVAIAVKVVADAAGRHVAIGRIENP